ncbi:MAG: LysR family transcriptional regulator [Caulobacter sp.]|nr:LysR family transcriptional regulator [Caulobacter sp.]
MDKLIALQAFVRAAEDRSFVAAGRQMGLSPSAVGKAVARLEEQLSARLFHRNTRNMTLTQEGAFYLERCRRILADLDEAEALLRASRAAPQGLLRVSLPLAGMLLTPAVAGFMAAYPQVRLDLDFSDRLVDVVEEGFDVVIRTGEGADSRLMSRKIGVFRHRVVAAPAYLAGRGRPERPADLAAHACLHYRRPGVGRLERWPLEGEAVDPPVAMASSTIEPLIGLAEAGLGLACLPDFAVARSLAEGRLEPVLDDFIATQGVYRALWPSNRHLPPKVRVFVDYMAAHLFA